MMARKASKFDCFSSNESDNCRCGACIRSVNENKRYECNVRMKAQIISDVSTRELAIRSDAMIREARSSGEELPAPNARRKDLAVDEENLRKKQKTAEGIQYTRDRGSDFDTADVAPDGYSDPPPEDEASRLIPQNYAVVYFDLETSGFRRSSDILQIAAKFQNSIFCSYVNPTQPVDREASEVTGLTNVGGELHLHGEKVDSIPIRDALLHFYEFLMKFEKPCLLVAHNAKFDAARLIYAVSTHLLIDRFQEVVIGFADTLPLFRKMYSERKGPGMFKLNKLAADFLNFADDNEKFHDALYDVEILEKICFALIEDNATFFTSWERLIDTLNNHRRNEKIAKALTHLYPLKHVVSAAMLKKIASAEITYCQLEQVQKTLGKEGVVNLLSERGIDKKPLVTGNKKILQTITEFIAVELESIYD